MPTKEVVCIYTQGNLPLSVFLHLLPASRRQDIKKSKMNESENFITTCQILGTSQILIKRIPSESYLINNISVIIFNAVLMIPTISLNFVASITILKSSQLKNKPCYFIILVQSVVDLGVGFFGIPSYIFIVSTLTGGLSNCFVKSLMLRFGSISVLVSMITVSVLTWERYIAIIHPYAYKTKVTNKRLMRFTISSAVLLFFLLILSYITEDLVRVYTTLSAALVFLFAAFAYTRIYLTARKLAHSPPNQPQNVTARNNVTRMKLFGQEIQVAKSCFIVVACFFSLCVLPQVIAFSYYADLTKFENVEIWAWVGTVVQLNSSVNSLIFFWTKKALRNEGIKFLKTIPCVRKTDSLD